MRVIDRTGFEFLMTEVRVGLTLARGASSRRIPLRRARTIGAARHAYDTIVRLAARLQLDEQQQRTLKRGTENLRSELEQLGEVF